MAESKGLKYLKIVDGSIEKKTYTFVVFTIVVVIVLIVGAIRPTVETLLRINKEINEKTIIDNQLETKIRNVTSLTNEFSSLEAQYKYLPLIFPNQGNDSLLLSNMDEIAKKNGYSLSSINFESIDDFKTKTKALIPWSVRVTVIGPRANLVPLLKDLESLPMYPIIKQVSFANNKQSSSTSIGIQMVVYRLDDLKFYNK